MVLNDDAVGSAGRRTRQPPGTVHPPQTHDWTLAARLPVSEIGTTGQLAQELKSAPASQALPNESLHSSDF